MINRRSPDKGLQRTAAIKSRHCYALMKTAASPATAIISIVLVLGGFVPTAAIGEELVRRPATVLRLQPETIGKIQFQWVYLRIEPKARTRDAKPFETRLDTTTTKILSVSSTGRRRELTRDALKPDMRVLVSGWTSISGVPTATAIHVLEAKQ